MYRLWQWAKFWRAGTSFRIAGVKYQSQARHTRILERKPFFDTFYSIGHKLEFTYFLFAQLLLNDYQAAH